MDTLRIAHASLRSKSYSLSSSRSDQINHVAVIAKAGREIKCCKFSPSPWTTSRCDLNPRVSIKTQRKPKKRQQEEPLHITRQVFNTPSNVHLVGSHLQFSFPCLRVLHQQLIHHSKHLFHDSILAQIVFALNRRQPQSLAVVSSSHIMSVIDTASCATSNQGGIVSSHVNMTRHVVTCHVIFT